MRRQKNYIALGLLVVFALGGIGGPLAHEIEHALDGQVTNRSHEHAHSKAGTSGFATAPTPYWAMTECVLCAPLVFDLPKLTLSSERYPYDETKSTHQEAPVLAVDRSNSHARAPPASA